MARNIQGAHGMNNDERVILLKKQVDEKREKINKAKKKFVPSTSLIVHWRGETKNLNVLNIDELLFFAWEMDSFLDYITDLGYADILVSGYPISSWSTDIHNKIDAIELKNKENDLKKIEAKLNKLLSDDKKTELELDEIAGILGE